MPGKNRELIHRLCPMCKFDNTNEKQMINNLLYCLKCCLSCGFVYLEKVPSYEILQSDFSWQKSWRDEKARRIAKEPTLHKFEGILHNLVSRMLKKDKLAAGVNHYIQRGRVLYAGCGVGHRVLNWSDDIIPYGIEIEPESAQRANEIFLPRGGGVICKSVYEGIDEFENGFFDGVVLCSYLEHEYQPVEVLNKIRLKVHLHNILIIKVPNYSSVNRWIRGEKWCGYRFPEHVNYFTPLTLVRTVEMAGFSVKRFNTFDRLPTSDNMWLIAKAK